METVRDQCLPGARKGGAGGAWGSYRARSASVWALLAGGVLVCVSSPTECTAPGPKEKQGCGVTVTGPAGSRAVTNALLWRDVDAHGGEMVHGWR